MLKTYRAFFKYALQEEYISTNPCSKVPWGKEDITLIKTFTDAEVKRMLNAFDGTDYMSIRNKAIIAMLIERAIRNGARIDSIGMQFHMFFNKEDEKKETELYYDPKRIYRVLDRYSDFGKPISITEITIPAYSQTAEDEEIQAEIIKWLYSIWFSHENVESIIYWNLVDGYAAFAPQGDMTAGENYYHGGLIRFDMTPKPAFYAIRDLFEKQWHTEETTYTSADGTVDFRGFYGDYEIIVDGKKKFKVSLTKGGENNFEIVL